MGFAEHFGPSLSFLANVSITQFDTYFQYLKGSSTVITLTCVYKSAVVCSKECMSVCRAGCITDRGLSKKSRSRQKKSVAYSTAVKLGIQASTIM